ncbi:54S ribosomal protein L7, mitochondrial [Komagataella phaffii CBS 7435]|uniref:Large ribosomal subunit protein uL5m n=2 Tax=Komagataella phaffii TaxID=460519 RepID=C4R8Z3_KOMPG|nr:mitochondrial 54S ribosomal protein YmL7/YmL5 [Komagataella phaffii GS115]AOA64509.1 GQ67_05190T0 [Komagataella phaffii]KAI0460876.1 mitochondrial 54S ribosomal protein YmL7/YmL5 [Komagataella kurtzmanii]CAH2450523.1 54S ribosomal protein L7, mitochondrial [Komagataella phaffii CBS 7435]AOA70402.1 GQ68_05172T0 [Komagataella phaffii GS115]CAY72068.1 Mitochondrial ribosomal protein of the large subunit [Komagataella phaffii GS115]
MFNRAIRNFSSSPTAHKVGCSIVKPVHHRVKIDKTKLSPKYPELKLSPNDIRSPKFVPRYTHQDRVQEYYENTLKPDLLLINYVHGQKTVPGNKRRQWDLTSPYHINRPPRVPRGERVPTPDIKPRTYKNIPGLTKITLSCFVKEAKLNSSLAIPATLQLQQITGVKPTPIYAKTNVPTWKLRPGMKMGAKVALEGREMSQFLSTLTELVLPRIREFKGISNRSGDRFGTISFGLEPESIKFFPEIEANQDLWPRTFGIDVQFHTSSQVDMDARILLSGLGIPFTGTERIPKDLLNDH